MLKLSSESSTIYLAGDTTISLDLLELAASCYDYSKIELVKMINFSCDSKLVINVNWLISFLELFYFKLYYKLDYLQFGICNSYNYYTTR